MSYIHEEIIKAMSKIQQKHGLTKTEVISEMAHAIHISLEFIEPSLKALCARLRGKKHEG